MSDTFTASNGSKVRWVEGELGIGDPPLAPLTDKGVVALREFFQHERDKELGRWRWPENPDYVVHPKERSTSGKRMVRVVSEAHGYGCDYCEGDRDGNEQRLAASAYFAAHPEPKPWHDAKPGEVWVLKYDGDDVPAIAVEDEGSPSFQFGDRAGDPSRVGTEHPDIVDARRIWPEAPSE